MAGEPRRSFLVGDIAADRIRSGRPDRGGQINPHDPVQNCAGTLGSILFLTAPASDLQIGSDLRRSLGRPRFFCTPGRLLLIGLSSGSPRRKRDQPVHTSGQLGSGFWRADP